MTIKRLGGTYPSEPTVVLDEDFEHVLGGVLLFAVDDDMASFICKIVLDTMRGFSHMNLLHNIMFISKTTG